MLIVEVLYSWQNRNLSRRKAKRLLSTCKQSAHNTRGDARLKLIELPGEGSDPPLQTAIRLRLSEKSLTEKNLAFLGRQRIDSLWKCFLPSDDETVRAECAGAGKKLAVSAVIAVSIATSVSERKRRSSNKCCNNFVVKDSYTKHRKQPDKKFELGRTRGVSLRVEDALVLYTSAQARKKKKATQRYKHAQHWHAQHWHQLAPEENSKILIDPSEWNETFRTRMMEQASANKTMKK